MGPVAALVAYAAGLLAADRFVGPGGQAPLGAVTALVLIAACRPLSYEERLQVAGVVVVATCFEVVGSVVWGLYRDRRGNLPLFVPPGVRRWAGVLPGVAIPGGNPPSGAASGYVLFDILAMVLAPLAAVGRPSGVRAA
ncbi:MAG TPA: hypothetical protein VJT33_11705 [bacterium]|nr:hypothetical protein [bacterium]